MKTKRPLGPSMGSLAKQGFRRLSRHYVLAAGLLLAVGSGAVSCSDKYDLDERTPDGWGSSIYGWLNEQGNFTNTVRLIDELGYHEVLAKTGSKTLFAADDEAYRRFYANNSWNVDSYEKLTLAQKKLLLFGSMIDNSIQVNNLSSVQGNPPSEGESMRRFSSTSRYDSVPVLKPEDMPVNRYWQRHIDAGKDMVCMEDGSAVPMIMFIEAQMKKNRITDDDYNFLFNNTVSRQAGDASINGVKIVQQNIRCANGFIHQMGDVITPLPNMAELIAKKPEVSMYNHLLERFCAPYPDSKDLSMTTQYKYLYGANNVDTVYTKKFFNSKVGVEVEETPDGGAVPAKLLFDPEWNSYYSSNIKKTSEGTTAEQRDMAVMMVPSDKALSDYWKGDGKPLSENYESWDDVPDDVLIELLNVNMLPSFVASVPSKFGGILNDANDPMGVEKKDVDQVWMACNGAVYQTNKVFSPTAYVSVSFPALINRNMKIIDWAIKENKYNVYLNALGTYYSFFIPTNEALLEYIDPCSYRKPRLQMLQFHWDDTKKSDREKVYADIYNIDSETGEREFVEKSTDYDRIVRCLQDILDTHIVIGTNGHNVWDNNHTYFRTKNGTGIRINNADQEGQMTVEGSYQMYDSKTPLTVTRIYDQRKEVTGGNGKTYVLNAVDQNGNPVNGQPIMGTRKTVNDQLMAHPEFSEFQKLLQFSGLLKNFDDNGTPKTLTDDRAYGGNNISVFNSYHYTVYVPTNESIKKLQNEGKLPTWETAVTHADSMKIVNFLKYHIQDNALYIGAINEEGEYETALINDNTRRFYMLTAKLTDDGIEVRDEADKAKNLKKKPEDPDSYHVVKKTIVNGEELFNIQAREYIYSESDALQARMLYTTSSAVIHLIDRPLSYEVDTDN